MSPMVENEPKAVKKRVEALKELYLLLSNTPHPDGNPVMWRDFTNKHNISSLFGSILVAKSIIGITKRDGRVKYYRWKVGEPNLQMARMVLQAERNYAAKRKETKKVEPEPVKKSKIGIRFPIVFRSIFYIKEA